MDNGFLTNVHRNNKTNWGVRNNMIIYFDLFFYYIEIPRDLDHYLNSLTISINAPRTSYATKKWPVLRWYSTGIGYKVRNYTLLKIVSNNCISIRTPIWRRFICIYRLCWHINLKVGSCIVEHIWITCRWRCSLTIYTL